MRTILIAHRDVGYATSLAGTLSSAGYRTIICPGPWPPAMRCIRCDVGYCPLTEETDLMVYDPDLEATNKAGAPYNLAVDSAHAHPDVPLILAWPDGVEPQKTSYVQTQVPSARIAIREPAAFLRQIEELIGSPVEAGAASDHYRLAGVGPG